jgi:DNA polymerase-3 subunit epsilon
MSKQLFIDLETTGLDHKTDTITQLAYIYRENGKIKKQGNYKTNIYKNFITDLDKMVDKFKKDDKLYFIAYNANFDSDFIRTLFLKNKNNFYGSYFYSPAICVMQMVASKFMRKHMRLENFKLGTVCKALGIKVVENNLHDAEYDIKVTKNLYNKLLKS